MAEIEEDNWKSVGKMKFRERERENEAVAEKILTLSAEIDKASLLLWR